MIVRYYSAGCDGCSQVEEIRRTPSDAWRVAQQRGWTCEHQRAEAGARPRGTYHYCPPCSRARAAASVAIEKALGVSVDGPVRFVNPTEPGHLAIHEPTPPTARFERLASEDDDGVSVDG